MSRENVALIAFNRGLIDKRALARIDIKRTAMSAEVQDNWMPRVLGSMMLRPGWGYTGGTKDNNIAYHIPFVASADLSALATDTALIELTGTSLRVILDDSPITRPSVSTAVQNGDFSSATGWTDIDESGGVSTIASSVLSLKGDGLNSAGREQQLSVDPGDEDVEHAFRIVVDYGTVTFRAGSTSGDDDYINETVLGHGEHSLAFIPTGSAVYIQFESRRADTVVVSSCEIESAGAMVLTTPWAEADLSLCRYDQSNDVVYVACTNDIWPRKLERRGSGATRGRSWSIVYYEPSDGPYRTINTSRITVTPSALTGDITLTASKNLFKATDVGVLYKIESVGQYVTASLTAENTFSDPIRVTGVGAGRAFLYTRAGTFTATWTIQRSVDEGLTWTDVSSGTTAGGPVSFNDGLDNQIILYRIGIKTGDYTSDTLELILDYGAGSITGIARVTAFTSATQVSAKVLTTLGNTTASDKWYEGRWSPRRGFPSATLLAQGRIWWGGLGRIIGSVSDAYESFDNDTEGDSAPIDRSIPSGPTNNISWLARLKSLVIGTDSAEWVAQSSSLEEYLKPTSFNLDDPSTQGSARVDCVVIDKRCIFAQRSGHKVFAISNAGETYGQYSAADLTELVPDLCEAGIRRMAVQRQPDTRVHVVLDDGTVGMLLDDPAENVLCWITISTNGEVEDVAVLPGQYEDRVYYIVKRVINSSTVRYREKWALESECEGGLLNKQADSFIVYDGTATTTITGLSHLEGETVVVWADGIDVGTKVVASGQITLDTAASKVVVGLGYNADFKSAKLAYAAIQGTALTKRKKIDHLGLIMVNTHCQGLKYGPDFDSLQSMPLYHRGAQVAADTVHDVYDELGFEFPGNWDTDSRLCLRASAPRPCTISAAVASLNTNG